ncbi:MAG: methyltransferase domain-containing protein [Clostridia bacterium]|nr:methyltransferase domain-containing protein [Clostridia bacterium]MBQ7789595.1 methyltransferase domain-containing protein [Clostridia bacterium]
MFLCPICKNELKRNNNSLVCEKRHSFDISASGYVNLLNPGKMNNKKAGDSKEMIKARSDFFASCAYKGISDKLCDIVSKIKNDIIVDAGAGEGYYTQNLAKAHTSSFVLGFDMSKYGCEHGAKVARREGTTNIGYCVGNIFDLPLKNEYCDVVTNLFAPVAGDEFLRILKKGGHLIVASAGINHLDGLKGILYNEIYLNEEKFSPLDGFELVDIVNLKYQAQISGNDTIKNLFTMTPYYHRTCLKDKEKLEGVSEINTCIEVNFAIYKKKGMLQ